jgi:hypothetical protein
MTSTGERDVPRERWGQFFAEIGRAYRGTPATLELLPADAGADRVAAGQPFAGVDCSQADGALRIQVGAGEHIIGAPISVRLRPGAGGIGQVIEIGAGAGPGARLYLGRDAQADAMRGAMSGQPVAPAMTTLGEGDDSPAEASEERGGPDTAHDRSPASTDREGEIAVGGSAGAAGGSLAAPAGSRSSGAFGDPAADLITFGATDKMGGAGSPTDPSSGQVDPGGSVGDADLSGRESYDITGDIYSDDIPDVGDVTGSTGDSAAADIIDLGGDQGVIDTTVDPIDGDQLVAGNDVEDGYVEGEVGAQAERDLDDMIGRRPQRKLPPEEKKG